MKKIVAIAAFLFLSGVALAQEEGEELVIPQPVMDAFNGLYPSIKLVNWGFDEVNYSASFKNEGNSVSLLFDESGSVVEVKNEIKLFELPLDVNHLLKREYADWRIGKASHIHSNGTAYYEAVVEKEKQTMVLVFNQHGGLLLKMML